MTEVRSPLVCYDKLQHREGFAVLNLSKDGYLDWIERYIDGDEVTLMLSSVRRISFGALADVTIMSDGEGCFTIESPLVVMVGDHRINGDLLQDGDLAVLNKGQGAYYIWAKRNVSGDDAVIDLDYIGMINDTPVSDILDHPGVIGSAEALGHFKPGTGLSVADGGVLNCTVQSSEIWRSLTGSYASSTTFTFSGSEADSKRIVFSLFTCTNSDASVRRIGYVKSATHSSGTVTATVVTDTDLASADKDFKVALNRKVQDYMHLISIADEINADESNSQGEWLSDVMTDSYLLAVDACVRTAATGGTATCAFNIYKGATALFSTDVDLGSDRVLRAQRPSTNTISEEDHISLRITASDGTAKARDFQARLFIVPQDLFTAF